MNTFCLKFLTLTLAFSIHGIASTPNDEDNKMRGAVSTAADARVERMQQTIRRVQDSYGPLPYCLPSGAVARVAIAPGAPTDRNLATLTQDDFVLLLCNEIVRKSDKEGGKTYRGAVSSASDDGHKKAIPLDFESRGPVAVAVASNAPAVAAASNALEERQDDADLSAILSKEEIAEQKRLFRQHEEEKATIDFLRAEREAQATRLAAYLAVAPYLVAPAVDDLTPEERCASFEAAANEAREKVTIFPVPSRTQYAETFTVKIGDLIEKALEGDGIELCHSHWKITNHGDFFSEFRGNCDRESMIQPTAVKKASEYGLLSLTYTFIKENGEFVELKLQEFKPLE
jgi:hypothetical protein